MRFTVCHSNDRTPCSEFPPFPSFPPGTDSAICKDDAGPSRPSASYLTSLRLGTRLAPPNPPAASLLPTWNGIVRMHMQSPCWTGCSGCGGIGGECVTRISSAGSSLRSPHSRNRHARQAKPACICIVRFASSTAVSRESRESRFPVHVHRSMPKP